MNRTVLNLIATLLLIGQTNIGFSQTLTPSDQRLYDIIEAVSAERLEKDITTLANFGTRHTMSDTISETRGIGAARRWIKAEFENISKSCGGCLEVQYMRNMVKGDPETRIRTDVEIVNVLAIQRGTEFPNRYVIMSGDIDSRVSDPLDGVSDSPGANDNATGMAGAMEAARVLSKYKFPTSIIYAGLSGEEQGLYGGKHMAEYAKAQGWDIVGVLNNDMIGNIEGGKRSNRQPQFQDILRAHSRNRNRTRTQDETILWR